jgi:SET domain-containing protein
MLQVRARAGKSAIHGIGLIAQEFIPKGTKVWEFNPSFDRLLSEHDVSRLSPAALEQLRWYAYHYDDGDGRRIWVLSSDDDRFTNHADDPNTQSVHDPSIGPRHLAASFAVRDIAAGEEITWNYAEFNGLNQDLRGAVCASST